MAGTPIVLRSKPGIKRDGTRFDSENYTDGLWVRFQRGLPRKIGGYRSITKYLTEISRGLAAWTQQLVQYCHSGSATKLERFTIDASGNSSIITDRTPGEFATGTVTLTGGASGSVDGITVDGVQIMSGSVAFNTDLDTTAQDVADDINAFTSSPNYTATAAGAVITISAATKGTDDNGHVVVSTATTITTTDVNMSGGETPLAENALNQWMFDYQYDASSLKNYIIAHVSPNGECVCNDEGGQIFFGEVTGTDKLVEIALPADANVTGGIVVLHPYLVYYGSDGLIGWSMPNAPTDLTGVDAGIARPWSQKFIKGLPLRGGAGSAPAGIFWAYDAVIRMSFTGGDTVFAFDVMATGTSIMSANSVIDYDGVFYWPGVDRFMMFNGVVREVPNDMCQNFFFDNVSAGNRPKVFAFKNTKYGEIWWCYPRGDATECTHAVIYNVRENTWYDTELPESGRSAGLFNNGFSAPLLAGASASVEGYKVWIHERGVDKIDGQSIEPVRAYIETADLSIAAEQGANKAVRVSMIEPDFIQRQDILVSVSGRANARSKNVVGTTYTMPESPTVPEQQIVMLKEQRRLLRVKFESDAVGGDFQMGKILMHVEPGDGTVLGACEQ